MMHKRLASGLSLCALGAGLGVLIAAGALLTAASIAGVFNTRPGTWTVRLAPFEKLPALALRVNVAGVVRLALSPVGQRLLDGGGKSTSFGHLGFRRNGRTLVVSCVPCRIDDPRLAGLPIELPLELRLTPDLAGEQNARITGVVSTPGALAEFTATLAPERIDLAWSVPSTEVATLVRILAAAVPEEPWALIQGTAAASGSLTLPTQQVHAALQLAGLAVHGLGTESLADGMFEQPCTDREGTPRRIINGPGSRFWLALESLGERLPAAVLAAEDQRFFAHAGYDEQEIGSALAVFDMRGPPAQSAAARARRGASTVTQQLARTLFTGGERSATRKLRELLYAVEMERTLGKRRILELYLNAVDWGPGLCGARSAARTYFRKAPERLSALEAAWLATSLRYPRRAYEREFLPGRADLARAHEVVAQMRSLPASERRRAARQALAFARAPRGAPIAASAVAAR